MRLRFSKLQLMFVLIIYPVVHAVVFIGLQFLLQGQLVRVANGYPAHPVGGIVLIVAAIAMTPANLVNLTGLTSMHSYFGFLGIWFAGFFFAFPAVTVFNLLKSKKICDEKAKKVS